MSFGSKIIIGHGNSIKHGCGYLFNDNRSAGGKLEEADCLCCNHCQKLLVGNAWRDDGGWCGQCGQPMCSECADKFLLPVDQGGGCKPFIKTIEEQIDKAYHQRQSMKIMGL